MAMLGMAVCDGKSQTLARPIDLRTPPVKQAYRAALLRDTRRWSAPRSRPVPRIYFKYHLHEADPLLPAATAFGEREIRLPARDAG